MKKLLLAILALLLCSPGISPAEVTLTWENSDPTARGFYIYEGTSAGTETTEQVSVPILMSYQVTECKGYGNSDSVDGGVQYVGGAELTKVTQPNYSAGNYYNVGGFYQFAAADAGAEVQISYSCAPYAVRRERRSVPESGIVTVANPSAWRRDVGVRDAATGQKLTRVSAGCIHAGEYHDDAAGTYTFYAGGYPSEVEITYIGSRATGMHTETVILPATTDQRVSNPTAWLEDGGVYDAANSVTFTKVNGTPAAGQYALKDNGTYVFNLADTGKVLSVTYTYTNYTKKLILPRQVTSVRVRIPAGTYYWRATSFNGNGESWMSNAATLTQESDDTISTPFKVGSNGTMKKSTTHTVEVGY